MSAGWEVHPEATFNVFGERGSIDILAFHPRYGALLIVEVKSAVPDMQSMLADLMTREWGRALAETVGQAQADEGAADTLARLTRGVVTTVRALRTNPLLRRIVELDPERLLPYLLERRGRSQEQIATLLADLVRAGQQDGSIRALPPDVAATTVLLVCQSFVFSARLVEAAVLDELALVLDGYLRA